MVIVLFATLSNVDGWEEMEYFARYQEKYLRKYIEWKNGIPSHDTIQRVSGIISPDILQQLYRKWQELLNQERRRKMEENYLYRREDHGREQAEGVSAQPYCIGLMPGGWILPWAAGGRRKEL